MKTTATLYGLCLAAGALLLRWLEYAYAVRMLPTEAYVLVVALAFTALGLWLGRRLSRPRAVPEPERNEQALRYLGVSDREGQVLELLAAGLSNREIARHLYVSPNTVKTHLAHLYGKLDVSRRTQAVRKARELRLILEERSTR